MPEVMTSVRLTTGRPELEPVAHPDCRICNAAHRGRSASRINHNDGGIRQYNAIIEAHPHKNYPDEEERQGRNQAEAPDNGEDSHLLATLRERVSEENEMRRSIRLDP
ncbi:hypothetical protein [Streptomyces platensis]